MPDEAANINLRMALEAAALAQSQGGIEKINKGFVDLKAQVQQTGAAADKALGSVSHSLSDLRTNVDANIKAVNELHDSVSKIKPVGEIFGKISSVGDSSGLRVEGLRRTGGALTQLGLGGPGEAVRLAGDIAEVTKSMKNMASVAIELPGIFGKLAQAGAGLGAAAGTTGAAFGALLVPIVAIALPVGALALAIGELKKRFEEGHNAVQQFLSDQAKDVEFRVQANQKAKTMTSQELKDRQAAIQQEIAERGKANQDLINQDAELRRQYAETGDVLKRAALVDTMKQVGGQVDEQNKKIKELSQEYQHNKDILDPLIKKREEEAAAIQKEISALEKKIAGQQQDAQLLQTGTVKGVEDRIQALANEKKAIEDNLPALEEEAKKSKEGEAELKKYKDRLAEVNKEQANLNDNILPYLKAKEEEKGFYAGAIKGSEDYIKKQKEYADLAATGTSEDLKKRIDGIEREKKAIQDGLPQLDALGETNEEAKQKAIELRKRLDELNQEEGKLTTDVKALIEAREAEQKAIEKQKAQAGIVEKLEDEQAAIRQKAADDRAAIIQKSEDEQTAIKERSARARADIEEKYGQKLVDIARNAADEAVKLLTDLEQKQADLRTTFGRDEAKAGREAADKTYDIQIKAQREERTALQEHLARIQEIRRGDYVQDQKDLLDRNFQSIYLRKLGQNQQIEQENTKFNQDRGKHQQTIQDEIQDAQRAAQIQRRERLIAFQQQQADAQLAYQRQLVAAKQAHDKELMLAQEAHARELADNRKKTAQELADLQVKTARELAARQAATTKELAARQAAAVKELQLTERTEAEKLKIIAKYAQKAQDLLRSSLTVAPPKQRAAGGSLRAGDVSWVNEGYAGQRESFNGAPFPAGMGLFIPAQGGNVNPGGGANNNVTININGAQDLTAVKREVVSALKQVMG